MQQYQIFLYTAVGAAVFVGFLFMSSNDNAVISYIISNTSARSLRLNKHLAPLNNTITIYLTEPHTHMSKSIFKTDLLQRYGTGRFKFDIKSPSQCSHYCSEDNTPPLDNVNTPCLAVASQFGGHYETCPYNTLKCNYPQCLTVVTNDEYCKYQSYDIRQYYSSNIDMSNKGYIPLGPRYDAYTSFQKIQSSPNYVVIPASKRRFVFNAIFTKRTNKKRGSLVQLLSQQHDIISGYETYIQISEKWNKDVNSPRTPQLDTDSYMKILGDSIFTLSPAGHNPECFRLYEAVEAGSIPVLMKWDMNLREPCKGSLVHWKDAPVLILNSWNELYSTVNKLLEEPKKLNEMQIKLRLWYDDYWQRTVRDLEDFIVDRYAQREIKSGKW